MMTEKIAHTQISENYTESLSESHKHEYSTVQSRGSLTILQVVSLGLNHPYGLPYHFLSMVLHLGGGVFTTTS